MPIEITFINFIYGIGVMFLIHFIMQIIHSLQFRKLNKTNKEVNDKMMQVLTTLNNEQEEGEEEMEEEGIYKDIQEAEEKLEVPKESYLEKIREPKGVTGTFPKEQTAQEILDEVVLKIEPNQIPIPEQGGKD